METGLFVRNGDVYAEKEQDAEMDIKVIWPNGDEERALAIKSTTGMGIGDLVSKVMVEREGEPVFIPCHMAKEIWIESFGERVIVREAAPVTVNMLQR